MPVHSSSCWTDPVQGVKGGVQMGRTWSYGYRTVAGGFGAGSDLPVLASLRLDARLSRPTSLGLGYAACRVDYETGSGNLCFRVANRATRQPGKTSGHRVPAVPTCTTGPAERSRLVDPESRANQLFVRRVVAFLAKELIEQ